jgi:hypothetical protein
VFSSTFGLGDQLAFLHGEAPRPPLRGSLAVLREKKGFFDA